MRRCSGTRQFVRRQKRDDDLADHRFVVDRGVRAESGFLPVSPVSSWIPWHRLPWRLGYWLPITLLDPLVACGVVTSALRHTYWAWIDHQRRVDQQDAMMEAEGAAVEANPEGSVEFPEVVTGAGGAWLSADQWEASSESVATVRH